MSLRRAIGRVILAGLFCLFGVVVGCTTMVRGTEQTVHFQTDPAGATVRINQQIYTTPVEVQLKRSEKYIVEISKPGYRSITFDFVGNVDGLSLVGNALLPGGSAGVIVDSNNGSNKTFYDLKTIKLQLPASTQPSEKPLKLRPFKGQLLDEAEYARAVQQDRSDKSEFFKGQP